MLVPLGEFAPVVTDQLFGGSGIPNFTNLGDTTPRQLAMASGNASPVWSAPGAPGVTDGVKWSFAGTPPANGGTGLVADLQSATAATINQIRQAFQIQRLLERDMRGGTRYTEILRAQFGVQSPDGRLQRPEYLGGGRTLINVSPIPQTSGTPATGTPQGNLAASADAVLQHGFSQSFVEHGYVIGLVNVRADLTYQQGMRKLWMRETRYDFYTPVFAHLGEQAVLQGEIYFTGTADDGIVFGYQERWAEMRYLPSMITGRFKSTSVDTLDPWHLAQHFLTAPELGPQFIEDNPPVDRVVAGGSTLNEGLQFYMDSVLSIKAARPMPLYSVPGLVDHF